MVYGLGFTLNLKLGIFTWPPKNPRYVNCDYRITEGAEGDMVKEKGKLDEFKRVIMVLSLCSIGEINFLRPSPALHNLYMPRALNKLFGFVSIKSILRHTCWNAGTRQEWV